MRARPGRAGAKRYVVAACALLQTLACGQLAFSVLLASLLAGTHAHAHAQSSMRDGDHFDLVLSHDATRDSHQHSPQAHLHGSQAEDHVVHLASQDARDPQRVATSGAPAGFAYSSPVLAAQPDSAMRTLVVRAVPSHSRRSVVLRS